MKKKPVKCKEVFRYICDNLGERIDSPQCRQIRSHLDHCPNCVAYLDSLKKTVDLYRKYSHPRLPERARRRLHTNLKLRISALTEKE